MSNPTKRIDAALEVHERPIGDATAVCAAAILAVSEEHGDLRHGDRWGPWVWNEASWTLDYTGPGYAGHPYGVDVEGILDAEKPDAEAWDWVRHVAAGGTRPPSGASCWPSRRSSDSGQTDEVRRGPSARRARSGGG